MGGTLVIYMVERDNEAQKRLLGRYREGRHSVAPSQGTRTSSPDSVSENEDAATDEDYIEDPTTGRRIYRHNALSVVRRLLEVQGIKDDFPCAEIQGLGKRFICSITIPSLKSRAISGSPSLSKVEARASAAFRSCRELFEHGFLDHTFFPATPASSMISVEAEIEKDGQASHASSTTRCYSRKLPQFWTNTISIQGDRLYPVVISVSNFRDGLHAPIVLLTRFWLPSIPEFQVFSSESQGTTSILRAAPISVGKTRLHALYHYTLRLSRGIVNKPITCAAESISYFFAPLDTNWGPESAEHTEDGYPIVDILWDKVEEAVDQWALPLLSDDGELPDNAEDLVVQDRSVEFTNRYFLTRVRRDLSPSSKPEEDEVST